MNPARGITPTTSYNMEFKEGLFISLVPIGDKETPAYRGKSLYVRRLLQIPVPYYIVYYRYSDSSTTLAMVTPIGQANNRKEIRMGNHTTMLDYVKAICKKFGVRTNKAGDTFKVITDNYQESMF